MGHPKIAIAINGFPPMAYTSLIAFVAAILPKVKGSSTMGKKKSVVLIIPIPFPISYTAASSLVSLPTNRCTSSIFGVLEANIVVNTFGDILHPQPAPWLKLVNFIVLFILSFSKLIKKSAVFSGFICRTSIF